MFVAAPMFSLIVPVYKNRETAQALVDALVGLSRHFHDDFEAVVVIDGRPDDALVFAPLLARAPVKSQLVVLSRNFGSFAAIRAGLECARGSMFAVMAADLQEPPEAIMEIGAVLARDAADVAVGVRANRQDSLPTRVLAETFWMLYRRFINDAIPPGGVDIFGCNKPVRDALLALSELNSSLVALLFWIGFRRAEVPYERRRRLAGKSAWTFRRKWRYLMDSIYSFSDLPIRVVSIAGAAGMLAALILGAVVLWARLRHEIPIPGYAATILAIMFFSGLNALASGILGGYVWRTFENTKGRPPYIIMQTQSFGGSSSS